MSSIKKFLSLFLCLLLVLSTISYQTESAAEDTSIPEDMTPTSTAAVVVSTPELTPTLTATEVPPTMPIVTEEPTATPTASGVPTTEEFTIMPIATEEPTPAAITTEEPTAAPIATGAPTTEEPTTTPTMTEAPTTTPTAMPELSSDPTPEPYAAQVLTPTADPDASDFRFTFHDGKVTITGYLGSNANVIIPSTIEGCPVTAIGEYAFYNKKIESVILSNSIISIGDEAFESAYNLKSVTLSDELTTIGSFAFRSCKSLQNISLPSKLTTIGVGAFSECFDLSSISIPASVASIGINAFIYSGVTEILVDPGNPVYTSVNGVLFNKQMTTLISYPAHKTGTAYTVPSGVESLLYGAFYEVVNLEHVSLPSSLNAIGQGVFRECTNLTSINLPSGLEQLGEGIFSGCESLQSIAIPGLITSIPDAMFNGCYSLERATIPATVTSIGERTFTGCRNVTIYGYTDSYAESYAEKNVIRFVDLNVPTPAPTPTQAPSDYDYYIENGQVTITNYKGSAISVTVPGMIEGYPVTVIGYSAFAHTSVAIQSITLPNSVTRIDSYAFANCDNLTSITLSSELISIGRQAFSHTKLESIIIPEKVTDIGEYAFVNCQNLDSITIPASVTSIGKKAFTDAGLSEILVSPGNSVYASSDGVLYDAAMKTLIAYPKNKADTAFTVPAGVEKIQSIAFSNAENLVSVTLPDAMTNIGDSAFRWCLS